MPLITLNNDIIYTLYKYHNEDLCTLTTSSAPQVPINSWVERSNVCVDLGQLHIEVTKHIRLQPENSNSTITIDRLDV